METIILVRLMHVILRQSNQLDYQSINIIYIFGEQRGPKPKRKEKNYKITLTLLGMQDSDKSLKRRFLSSLGGTSRKFTSYEL